MNTIFIRAVITFVAILLANHSASAQDGFLKFGMDYATEIQSDFGRKVNWVNMLSLEASCEPWHGGELSLQTISTYKTRKKQIINDLQTFSNIEEDNMVLNIFLLGYTHRLNRATLFGGIRNVNMDYFAEEYTSLFTNSSCGIYPTLAVNFSIANYPLSALCVHGEFELGESVMLKNSLYNGVARKLLSKEGSLFTLNPEKDGIINITELSYLSKTDDYGFYNIGCVFSAGGYSNGGAGAETTRQEKKRKVNYSLWGSVEKSIYTKGGKTIGVLLQGSFAPRKSNDCIYYFGAGIILHSIIPTRNENTLGIFCNRAIFKEVAENTVEITWRYHINDYFTIQPALHCVNTGSTTKILGLLRLCCNI